MSYSNSLVPRRTTALSRVEERRNQRELDMVDHETELAEQKVAGINRVTQRALYETMLTSELRQKAEQIAPDGAELYAMIAVAGAVESTKVIGTINSSRRRCR
jgi:hypothetical protein